MLKKLNTLLLFFFFGKYHARTYWYIRNVVTNASNNTPFIIKNIFLFFLNRCDRKNNGSIATFVGGGAVFKGTPYLVHQQSGCHIARNAIIGEKCVIFQNVTIGIKSLDDMDRKAPEIGDNCVIGAGACLLGGIKVGDNVKIGANTVVLHDVPSNSTVVGVEGRIINKQ